MKKINKIVYVLLLLLLFVPLSTYAFTKKENYKRLNYLETLDDEEIEYAFDSYKENKNAVTIYLFRGHGCGYCRAFLNFLNSITDEYGDYFVMESFEVWNDSNNNKLMQKVSSFLEQSATGVPFIIIGDEVFAGFSEELYGDAIKAAIKNLYNTKKEDRYDVFEEILKSEKANTIDYNKIIFWGLGFTLAGTLVSVVDSTIQHCSVMNELRKIEESSKRVIIEKPREEEREETKKVVKKHK